MMTRILLIDDHAIFVAGIKRVLNDQPNTAVVADADNGDDALAEIAHTRCDLVLLDINLADENGLDVLDRIRRTSPDLPVIILSMYPESQYSRLARDRGAQGYLCKDSRAEQLISAIRVVASGRPYFRCADDVTGLPHERLSRREKDVFMSIARGEPMVSVAGRLGLSIKTIATYRTRTLEKLDLHTNAAIIRYAVRNHLVGV
ncbi:MAG: response regulator transcription factor [Rhizobiaceae bacterium]